MLVEGKTDVGRERQKNEDCYLIISNNENIRLFAVADGMGGHKGGEVASSLAMEFVKDYFYNNREQLSEASSESIKKYFTEMFRKANEKIWEEAFYNKHLNGMGTTLTVALLIANHLVIGHIGDSRAYLISKAGMWQLTEDHSYVQKLVNENHLEAGEEENHPQRNVLTRALGTDRVVDVDIYFYTVEESDNILLCTDGLTRTVSDMEVKDLILTSHSPSESVEELVDLANARGGPDNITALVVRLDTLDSGNKR